MFNFITLLSVLDTWTLRSCHLCFSCNLVSVPFQVGLVIGKGGESIKSMQAKSGAQIKVCNHLPYLQILVAVN
jgi:hypothetical protein